MTTAPDAQLSAALLLGWRVAELYALVDDTGEPASDTLLPSHGSLEPADQLELQLCAAAGDARRAGVTAKDAALDDLVSSARAAADSPAAAEVFRARLRRRHIEVQKDLWARDEALGKAYELGNGLSDTYGRVCRAYRHHAEDALGTWEDVFLPDRIERLKKLLDDLQSRLNTAGVAVVRAQLDAWCAGVGERLRADGLPPEERVRDGAAAPDDHLAPAADRRQGAGGLPRPARARRAARRHARADLAPLPALGARAGGGDRRGGRWRGRTWATSARRSWRPSARSGSPRRRSSSPSAGASTSGRRCCGSGRWR